MNRKIYAIAVVVLSFAFASCGTDEVQVDEEWKAMNEATFNRIAQSGDYLPLASPSGNGSIYWRESNVLTDSELIVPTEGGLKISPAGNPEFRDTVVVRYEGWFLDRNGEKVIFDTTEGANNKVPRQFGVNQVIEGWMVALQNMTKGQEKEIWIPWQLAYGAYGKSSTTSVSIPGYTTLAFNVRLIDIIPMRGTTASQKAD